MLFIFLLKFSTKDFEMPKSAKEKSDNTFSASNFRKQCRNSCSFLSSFPINFMISISNYYSKFFYKDQK